MLCSCQLLGRVSSGARVVASETPALDAFWMVTFCELSLSYFVKRRVGEERNNRAISLVHNKNCSAADRFQWWEETPHHGGCPHTRVQLSWKENSASGRDVSSFLQFPVALLHAGQSCQNWQGRYTPTVPLLSQTIFSQEELGLFTHMHWAPWSLNPAQAPETHIPTRGGMKEAQLAQKRYRALSLSCCLSLYSL